MDLALENAQRLVIYIGEADRWRGKPLYAALLETLKREGLAGATVVRGVAGFGAHSRIHTASILRLSEDLPLRIEVIDTREKIERALEMVAPMVNEGLITLDDVRVIKYTHRFLNPLPADRLVAEVMTGKVVTLTPEMSLADAWERMLKNGLKGLPVIDGKNTVVGFLTDEDLMERAKMGARLAMAQRLDAGVLKLELQALAASSWRVADVMSKPPILTHPDESLGIAAARMGKAQIKRLPVVNEEGKLVGVLARLDILRQVADAQTRTGTRPATPQAGRVIGDVMRRDIPIVRADASLEKLVNAFVSANTHRLIVIDAAGLPLGLVSDADVVSRIQPEQQKGMLDALSGRGPVPGSAVIARDVMSPEVLSVPPEMPLTEATQKMLALARKWLIVTEEGGKPIGLVDRQTLLLALSGTI